MHIAQVHCFLISDEKVANLLAFLILAVIWNFSFSSTTRTLLIDVLTLITCLFLFFLDKIKFLNETAFHIIKLFSAFYRNNPKASHLKSETNLNANSPSSNRMEDDDLMESELPTHCSPISKAKYAFSAAQSILDMLCRVIAGGALAYYFLRVDSSDIGDYAPI